VKQLKKAPDSGNYRVLFIFCSLGRTDQANYRRVLLSSHLQMM